MFNDRDLFIIGAGALLAVFCLVLPFSFAGKVVVGLGVLIGFMVLALLRLGPDRIPFEEWLRRRIRFRLQARRYTYQQPGYDKPRKEKKGRQEAEESEPLVATRPTGARVPLSGFQPVGLALEEIGIYPLATVFLSVVGIYFLSWLAQGGATEIGRLFAIIGG